MRYLLDVNVLLALGLTEHEFHHRVVGWLKRRRGESLPEVATCPITELAFVRILSQPVYHYSVREARTLLAQLKAIPDLKFSFLADDHSSDHLPNWVTKPGQVTDGHLAELARAHGAVLATLDAKIAHSFLIPT